MIAGRGNTKMRAMLRRYDKERAPARPPAPARGDLLPLEVPEEGRSTFRAVCPGCGAKFYPHLTPERCLLCGQQMTHPRRWD